MGTLVANLLKAIVELVLALLASKNNGCDACKD